MEFVYEGIYSGSTEWKIDQDGQFGVTIEVKTDTRTFTNYISGEVSETGEVTGISGCLVIKSGLSLER